MDLTPLELNEIANLIDINVIRKLGLHLGLEHAEIQRYEKTNNQNPSQCAGTEDMLVAWNRNGGTRALLCAALQRVEQRRLACRIEDGEFRAEPVASVTKTFQSNVPVQHVEPEAALHVHTSNTQTGMAPAQGKVAASVKLDEVLPRLAEEIDHNRLEQLGHALKFKAAQINRYTATNFISGRVSTRGTFDMLHDWKSRTSISLQKGELREALIRASMVSLADEHLPLE